MDDPSNLHVAVALDGAGWHPAAWRDGRARPGELFAPRYWADLAAEAERALLDFITFEDSMAIQSEHRGILDDRLDHVRGRLDAVLVAARVAPLTAAIGLVPVATTTHTEPFHLSKAVATLDFVSSGRAGFQARISPTALEARQFGRRGIGGGGAARDEEVGGLFDEAADYVEVTRRLWDSWEDDAEIRDVATGRFLDRDKLHYIDFEGPWFSVKGPSITPRPPQGQPPVAMLAHVPADFHLAARSADVVFITPKSAEDARAIVAEVRTHEVAIGRAGPRLRMYADMVVFVDEDGEAARSRKEALDELDSRPLRSDAHLFAGSVAELADLLEEWGTSGIDGFRLRPGTLPGDLEAISRQLVPVLQQRGRFRDHYEEHTLRGRLGLRRPENRYAHA